MFSVRCHMALKTTKGDEWSWLQKVPAGVVGSKWRAVFYRLASDAGFDSAFRTIHR